ncbi:hypothetical protein NIES4071_09080 [Calothrix sp. NIES-4071]|nr:hypothetical protein NIES4071_09080 [Calothrix sp. NIES-4071]BAZ55250.1 hypothetical protein NIES4105_09040 [Calothrix sp. NIES-4105]
MRNHTFIKVVSSAFLLTLCTNLKVDAFQLSGKHRVDFTNYELQADVPGFISNFPATLDTFKLGNSFEEFDFDNNKVYQQVDLKAAFDSNPISAQLFGSGILQNVQVLPTDSSERYSFLADTNITTGGFRGDESDEYSFEHTETQKLSGIITLDSQGKPNFSLSKTFSGSGIAASLPGADENINVPVQYRGTASLKSISVPEPNFVLAQVLLFGVLGIGCMQKQNKNIEK